MSVGKPQHSYDQNGKHSSKKNNTLVNLVLFEMRDLRTVDFTFCVPSCLSSHVCALGTAMFVKPFIQFVLGPPAATLDPGDKDKFFRLSFFGFRPHT